MRLSTAALVLAFTVAPLADVRSQGLSVAPTHPKPGAVVRLTLGKSIQGDSVTGVGGELAGEPLHFIRSSSGTWHAIAGIPVDATGSLTARAVIHRAAGAIDTVRTRVTLSKAPRPTAQPLAVDNRFTQPLDAATRARIDRENATAREIGRRSHDSPPLWTASFLKPRTSIITSPFGSGRLFNGQLTARHLGVDFRGAAGAPVRATNRGVVALVGDFFLAGNVVYVDHGAGVVTAYFHLSKTLVAEGDTVERGQVLGLVGSSGRVTGPHLHWAARYGEITVNPLDLVGLDGRWYGRAAGAQ